jgi:hypothetical protein
MVRIDGLPPARCELMFDPMSYLGGRRRGKGSMRHQDRKWRVSQRPPGKTTENPFSEPAVSIAAHDQEASSSFHPCQQRIGRVLVIRTDLFHLDTQTMTT